MSTYQLARRSTRIATTVAAVTLWAACALAEEVAGPQMAQATCVHHGQPGPFHDGPSRCAGTFDISTRSWFEAGPRRIGAPASPSPQSALEGRRLGIARTQRPHVTQERSVRRKILGAVVGGAGGFFGGMFLGAAIEGDRCNCDDPGLMGALIGGPVGAGAGGVLGYRFLF